MNPGSYIAKFLHSDEFFWVEAVPEPTAKDDGPYEVDRGAKLTVNGVLDNDVGVQLTAAVKTQPSHGTVSVKPDGSFTYTHDGSTAATDSFTYRAQDPAGTFDDATVSISVDVTVPPPPPPPTGTGHTVGLVDPAMGEWHLYDDAGKELTSFFFGNPGDFPIVGDWDCDGEESPGMYRQSDGFVYLRNSNSQGVADIKFFFGDPGDVPLAGDFNGDGCDTVSIYRPAQSKVFIINELGENNGGLGEAEFSYFFGNPGDKPFVGDFNGNGAGDRGAAPGVDRFGVLPQLPTPREPPTASSSSVIPVTGSWPAIGTTTGPTARRCSGRRTPRSTSGTPTPLATPTPPG